DSERIETAAFELMWTHEGLNIAEEKATQPNQSRTLAHFGFNGDARQMNVERITREFEERRAEERRASAAAAAAAAAEE
ncbi:hypothetical protein THAOC_25648, partial [Thalassiosira oceanica]